MFLPDGGKKIYYTYASRVISLNLTMMIEQINNGCKLFTVEGPFIGKYNAALCEDTEYIYLLSYGKGLFYGRITEESLRKPLFKLSKDMVKGKDIYLFDKYVLSLLDSNSEIVIGNKKYSGCILLNLVYDSGKYVIYVKEGIGVLRVRNIKNGDIVEEISIKEA